MINSKWQFGNRDLVLWDPPDVSIPHAPFPISPALAANVDLHGCRDFNPEWYSRFPWTRRRMDQTYSGLLSGLHELGNGSHRTLGLQARSLADFSFGATKCCP